MRRVRTSRSRSPVGSPPRSRWTSAPATAPCRSPQPTELGRASTGIATRRGRATRSRAPMPERSAVPLAIAPGITITGLAPGPHDCAGDGHRLHHRTPTPCSAPPAPRPLESTSWSASPKRGPNGSRHHRAGHRPGWPSAADRFVDGLYQQQRRLLRRQPGRVGPGRALLAPGTSTTIALVGHPLPGVVDPGPIVIPDRSHRRKRRHDRRHQPADRLRHDSRYDADRTRR